MALFLFRFYPIWLPLLVYLAWLSFMRRRALKKGEVPPRFRDGPIYWLLIATLLMAVGCFVVLGLSIEGHKGVYQPPHMEGNTLIPAQVTP